VFPQHISKRQSAELLIGDYGLVGCLLRLFVLMFSHNSVYQNVKEVISGVMIQLCEWA